MNTKTNAEVLRSTDLVLKNFALYLTTNAANHGINIKNVLAFFINTYEDEQPSLEKTQKLKNLCFTIITTIINSQLSFKVEQIEPEWFHMCDKVVDIVKTKKTLFIKNKNSEISDLYCLECDFVNMQVFLYKKEIAKANNAYTSDVSKFYYLQSGRENLIYILSYLPKGDKYYLDMRGNITDKYDNVIDFIGYEFKNSAEMDEFAEILEKDNFCVSFDDETQEKIEIYN